MERLSFLGRIICLALASLWATVLLAQSPFLVISPQKVILLVGQSKTFRLTDQNGIMPRGISWSLSDIDAFDVEQANELTVTAKQKGEFRIKALSSIGSAETTVTVMEGQLPEGTAIWSGASIPECTTHQVVQAVPTPTGPDLYELIRCPDGEYVAAYTSDGRLLWRHKVGADDAPVRAGIGTPARSGTPRSNVNVQVANRLDTRSTSICDLVSIGADQRKVCDLLEQHKLSFNESNTAERMWVVDEPGAQCRLWFDDKSVLSSKRKTLVTE